MEFLNQLKVYVFVSFFTVTVFAAPPTKLDVSSNSYSFDALEDGNDPNDQILTVSNTGGGTLNWSIDTTGKPAWLTITPLSGALNQDQSEPVTLSVDITGLSVGNYSYAFDVSDPAAQQSPQTVTVELLIWATGDILVPADYPTIQAAIDAAVNGNTIIVQPGTYYENINFGGKDITLTSTDPSDSSIVAATVIDGNAAGSVVTFAGSETSECQLLGFKITNGDVANTGGGIYGNGTYARIDNCWITGNHAGDNNVNYSGRGGGLHSCNGIISNCKITNNVALFIGGGIGNSYGLISNCIFAGNLAIYDGGAIGGCDGTINNCTIVKNTANQGGGLAWCDGTITNCIIWNNDSGSTDQLESSSTPTYSCIQDWTGGGIGNITDDPLFVDSSDPDPANWDLRLQGVSPCIDTATNTPSGGLPATDIEGVIRPQDGDGDSIAVADMGAYENLPITDPMIGLSANTFNFTAEEAGANPADQTLTITNVGINTLNWSVVESCSWLSVSPASGSSTGEGDDVALSVDITSLTAGSYNCIVTITDPAALNSPQTVTVDLDVTGPILNVSATAFSFTAEQGGVNPADQSLTVSNTGGGTVNWSLDTTGKPAWLTITPTSGSLTNGTSEPVTLSVDITGLPAGSYSYAFDVSDPAAQNSPQTVTVDLDITGPILDVSGTAFSFTASESGANPADQALTVSNTGSGTVNWSIDTTGEPNWLTITPTSGSLTNGTNEPVTLSVDITGLSAGSYSYAFDVSDPAAANSPQNISVQLLVGSAGVIYVPADFLTIQEAIDAAVNGNTVVIAPGTYTGSGNRDLDTLGKWITVRGTDPDDPNVVAATIIDCQGTQAEPHRGFFIHSGETLGTTISGLTITNGVGDGGGGAIYVENSAVTIDRCYITGNAAKDGAVGQDIGEDGDDGGDGGGILCSNSTVVIDGCSITLNSAGKGGVSFHAGGGKGGDGGGIGSVSSTLTIIDSQITDNISGQGEKYPDDLHNDSGDGGGIYSLSTALSINNSVIENNTAADGLAGAAGARGGGIYCDTAVISNSQIIGNSSGNGVYNQFVSRNGGDGGGIYCLSQLDLSNCTISANTTGYGGDGDYMRGSGGNGAGVFCSPGAVLSADQCIIEDNVTGYGGDDIPFNAPDGHGGSGGGIYAPQITITNSRISNNITGNGGSSVFTCGDGGSGAGIYCDSSLTVINCLINGNTTGNGGDAGLPDEGGDGGNGGGVYCSTATGQIINSTIVNNLTGEGGPGIIPGQRGRGGGVYAGPNLVFTDLVVWGNDLDQLYGQDCANVTYCDIQDAVCSGSTGNISADPNFVTGAGGDYYLSQTVAGQAVNSPCLDAGSDTAVNLGLDTLTTRTDNNSDVSIVDMGYHYAPTTNIIYVPADYPTIQAAIDAAVPGDTVIVSPGTYVENIDFGGKDIVLTSTNSTNPNVVEATVIDGGHSGSVVTFSGSETSACQLRGFTITNGGMIDHGGGILGNSNEAVIDNCIIQGNVAYFGGGVALCNGSITNCTITDNVADGGNAGGLSFCHGAITNCVISNNQALGLPGDTVGGGGLYNCDGPITNCLVINNYVSATPLPPEVYDNYGEGGGLYYCDGVITNCTITGNTISGSYFRGGGSAYSGSISNCIIWNNTGSELYSYLSTAHSCIQDWAGGGTGNISADPNFVTGPGGDFYLSQIASGQAVDSPCVNAGSDTAANLGLDTLTTRTDQVTDGSLVDMGYHYSVYEQIGDINGDVKVNLADYCILAAQWLDVPGTPSADIAPYPDGDNTVDLDDLLLLLENWLD